MTRAKTLAAAALLTLAACARKPPDATPEGAVREFVERMRAVRGDAQDAKAGYELLSKRAQANLTERAQRYSFASGKPIAAEMMITPSKFALRFEPQRYVAVQVAGSFALVEVTGLAADQRARVPCVFEGTGWRVDMALPPLPPVQKRPNLR
ncbi:MAG TPA: hypothetical protein VGM56_13100 [Byssovorax sp.]|jgi:uncharacterized protein YbjT (DUF2867 family)